MKQKFQNCLYKEVEDDIVKYNNELTSPIDSFAESRILNSKHYKILLDDIVIGYCSIYKGNVLTQFYVKEEYRNVSQDVFEKAKCIFR